MRLYYDVEFLETGACIDFISIGMVAEDGRELYAVSDSFDQESVWRHPFLKQHVWPSLPIAKNPPGVRGMDHLDVHHPDVRPRPQIARMVHSFIQRVPDVELWSWYCGYDHVALCGLWGTMADLPEGVPMFTHDLQQEISRLGNPAIPEQKQGHHHALEDARYHAAIGRFLTELENQQ